MLRSDSAVLSSRGDCEGLKPSATVVLLLAGGPCDEVKKSRIIEPTANPTNTNPTGTNRRMENTEAPRVFGASVQMS